jgi:lipoyl(octanoyl) transferase
MFMGMVESVVIMCLAVTAVDSFLPGNGPRRMTMLKLSPQQLGTFEKLTIDDSSTRTVQLFDWSSRDPLDFNDGWNFQKDLMSNHLNRLNEEQVDTNQQLGREYGQFAGFDSIIMLQHSAVFTLGTGSSPDFVLSDSVPVVRMDRGGEVTYHGPGQLVVYPVIDLRGYKQDIHWYMRALEEAILLALKKAGIQNAVREDDVTGVWIDCRKVAALGIKARRWITQHGLAINVTPESLANFRGIVPCGLEGREVTCVNDHLPEPISVRDFAQLMREALEEVFCIRMVAAES